MEVIYKPWKFENRPRLPTVRWEDEGRNDDLEDVQDSSGSISSEEEGVGEDFAARARRGSMTDIWPTEDIVSVLRQMSGHQDSRKLSAHSRARLGHTKIGPARHGKLSKVHSPDEKVLKIQDHNPKEQNQKEQRKRKDCWLQQERECEEKCRAMLTREQNEAKTNQKKMQLDHKNPKQNRQSNETLQDNNGQNNETSIQLEQIRRNAKNNENEEYKKLSWVQQELIEEEKNRAGQIADQVETQQCNLTQQDEFDVGSKYELQIIWPKEDSIAQKNGEVVMMEKKNLEENNKEETNDVCLKQEKLNELDSHKSGDIVMEKLDKERMRRQNRVLSERHLKRAGQKVKKRSMSQATLEKFEIKGEENEQSNLSKDKDISKSVGKGVGKDVGKDDSKDVEKEQTVEQKEAAVLWACWQARPAALHRLLEDGASATAQDPLGRTALHLAALVGSAECVRLLLKKGAPVRCWDKEHRATPLHCAASARSLVCIQILEQYGAEVSPAGCDRSPLHYAVMSDSPPCVGELLRLGAPAYTMQVLSETPLHVAAMLGRTECAALLLAGGAHVAAQMGRARLTALHLAAEDGHVDCARLLLDKGAFIDASNSRLQTPLHFACIAQSLELVQLFVERGADVLARDAAGRAPLHAALGRTAGSQACARALLVAGANPDQPDCYGFTPLHMAAINEFSSCVSMLIEYGGDLSLQTGGGQSVLAFMMRRTPDALPRFLRRLDAAVRVAEHELGDVDCEVRLDLRPLVPPRAPRSRGEAALLLALVEGGCRDVLKHPLCETFLFLKWRRIRKFFLASLIYYCIFVLLLSCYIVGVYLRNCKSTFEPKTLIKAVDSCIVSFWVHAVGCGVVVLDAGLAAKELFQCFQGLRSYARRWENWLQWLIIISVFLCVVPGGKKDDLRRDVATWQHHVAAVGIFLAWVELMLIVGRFPMFGIFVQMFATVALNFAKFLMAYSCMLFAFALSFGVLFSNQEAYKSVLHSLLKTVIMMSGELEFEDIFYQGTVTLPGTAHVIFLAFVIMITIILTNLLVGLAVSNIQALQESAGLDRLVRQVGLVQRLEWLLFSPLLRCLPTRALKLLHRWALLLDSPNFSICIRPNDPRENRLPKEIIDSIYQLMSEKKERAKKSRGGECFGMFEKSFAVRSNEERDGRPRPRTTSDAAGMFRQQYDSTPPSRQLLELTLKVEKLQRTMDTRLASIQANVQVLSQGRN